MIVVVGFIEEGLVAQFYNTAVMLKDGKVVHLHRKVNLANYGKLEEGKHFTTGRFVETYSLDKDWRAGLLICADLWNPALTHLAFLRGATLMITPVSSGIEAVGQAFNNPEGVRAVGPNQSLRARQIRKESHRGPFFILWVLDSKPLTH